MIANGLDVIPEGINIIIISRTEPPPQFSRLIANNKIHTIDWEEIKFNLEETKAFIVGAIRRVAQNKAIQNRARQRLAPTLHQQTNGWAAGMVLMLEDAKNNENNPPSPPFAKGGFSNETVFNYFAAEIFNKTDKETQNFLLKTAFLPDMTVDMAERLTGAAHASGILAHLNRSNYFTQRQSGQHPSYRYHPLFREFLLSRVDNIFQETELSDIRRNAAMLLMESGQTENAAALFIDAKDWNGLVMLILKNAQALISEGRSKSIEQWIQSMPQEIVNKTPGFFTGSAHAGCRLILTKAAVFLKYLLNSLKLQKMQPALFFHGQALLIHSYTDGIVLLPLTDGLQ